MKFLGLVRKTLLLNWGALMTGCLLSYVLLDWPVMVYLASLLGSFGMGVMVMAYAVADDYKAMRAEVDRQREVNRKIVERAKR